MPKHLTKEEREVISNLLSQGQSQQVIANHLKRSPSTISREIRRNQTPRGYSAMAAQEKAEARRRNRPRQRKMDKPHIRVAVTMGLTRRWSPDQIAGRLKRDFPNDPSRWVSHQTIYDWIPESDDPHHWRSCLRRGGKKPGRDRRGQLPGQVVIKDRPEIVSERGRYGDWEGDTVVGARRHSGLVTLNERKSGYVLLRKVHRLDSEKVTRAIHQRLQAIPSSLRLTMTFDNGKEFSRHKTLAKNLSLSIYFADPGKPHQRGSNEHLNGLVRDWLPKGTDFRQVGWQTIREIEESLNNRPRKRLNYQTPTEVLQPLLDESAVAIET